jgi:hypothetical protein
MAASYPAGGRRENRFVGYSRLVAGGSDVTMRKKEPVVIELTEQQSNALEHAADAPPRVVDPRTHETFVLLRTAEYEKLLDEYDDSPWTREEMLAMAWHVGKSHGWEEDTDYDDLPEKP